MSLSIGGGGYALGATVYTVPEGYDFFIQRLKFRSYDANPVADVAFANFGSGEILVSTWHGATMVDIMFPEPFPQYSSGEVLKMWTERGGTAKVLGFCQVTGFLIKKATP